MEKIVQNTSIIKIALIGPESTAKSTLSKKIADYYKTVFVPEFARKYIENLSQKYTYEDIEIIARKQVELEHQALRYAKKYVFIDTELILTKVWFDVVFNKHPNWIEKGIIDSQIKLYLLCSPDIPWEYDSVRENPDKRDYLFNCYKKEIERFGFDYEIITGMNDIRFKNSIKAIEQRKL